jgi:hypothetical protein
MPEWWKIIFCTQGKIERKSNTPCREAIRPEIDAGGPIYMKHPKTLHQIDCFGKAKNVPDILCSSHSIIATGTGGFGCNFVPTETGSISRSPDTFHIRATDTAVDTLCDTLDISHGNTGLMLIILVS